MQDSTIHSIKKTFPLDLGKPAFLGPIFAVGLFFVSPFGEWTLFGSFVPAIWSDAGVTPRVR